MGCVPAARGACFFSTRTFSSQHIGQCGCGPREGALPYARGASSKFRGATSATLSRPGGFTAPVPEIRRPKSMSTRGMRNRKGHDGYVSRAFVALDAPQELMARHLGQIENEQDQLRSRRHSLCVPAGAEQVIQPGLPIADDFDGIRKLRALERARHRDGQRGTVVHEQDLPPFMWRRSNAVAKRYSRRRIGMGEQIASGDVQRSRQVGDGQQCHVACTSLNVRDISAVQVGPPSELLLRNS
jgi:hypothetical protein